MGGRLVCETAETRATEERIHTKRMSKKMEQHNCEHRQSFSPEKPQSVDLMLIHGCHTSLTLAYVILCNQTLLFEVLGYIS